MFLATVIIGNTVALSPDKNIRFPPLMPGKNISYDSVKGNS
jgi:hypothetical protein